MRSKHDKIQITRFGPSRQETLADRGSLVLIPLRVQTRKSADATVRSAVPLIVLQKSFLADERNFLGPLMRFVRGDVRDHIVSHKNDHGFSYQPYRALQR